MSKLSDEPGDYDDFDEPEEPDAPCSRCHKVGPIFLPMTMRSMATDITVSGKFCIKCTEFAEDFLREILIEEVAKTRRIFAALRGPSVPPKLNRAERRALRRK